MTQNLTKQYGTMLIDLKALENKLRMCSDIGRQLLFFRRIKALKLRIKQFEESHTMIS